MSIVNYIYSDYNLNFNDRFFLNQCHYLKSLNYDFIKIDYNDDVSRNIKEIINIIEKIGIKLIITIKNNNLLNKLYSKIKYVEIFEPCDMIDISKNLILNTTWDEYCKIYKGDNKYFNIIITDIYNISYNENNINLGIYITNENDICYTNLGVKNFYIKNSVISTTINDWSGVKKKFKNFDYTFFKQHENKLKIIVTGVTGQDGSNLVEYLLNNVNNIIIFGTIRDLSSLKNKNLSKFCINNKFIPIILDLCDEDRTKMIFKSIMPDYFFNCAAQSVVNKNVDITTLKVNTLAPLFHMDCIKNITPKCKYLSCGSCEEFGITEYYPQDLSHNYNPINIYGITKLATHNIVKFYRKQYNLYLCHVILYNHEGIKRGVEFVSRKISKEVVRIKNELDSNEFKFPMLVGNIFSKRDWSDSEDFVEAFWKILNHNTPQDYILSSGCNYTVKEMIDIAFKVLKIKLKWHYNSSKPLETKAIYKDKILVTINKKYYRDNDEKRNFIGETNNTRKKLNWQPKVSFEELITKMVKQDLCLYNL
uniref:GDP-mannose 4,6-dehydratase n=1 Tax=viral metagenome TaxID=1070528 RepID=A0A6C0C0K2_9ZZZZ